MKSLSASYVGLSWWVMAKVHPDQYLCIKYLSAGPSWPGRWSTSVLSPEVATRPLSALLHLWYRFHPVSETGLIPLTHQVF